MLDPYFQKAEGRKLKAIRNWIFWKLIESKVVNNADGLLFTCEEEKRLATQPFKPYKPKQELVVGLGVDEPPVYSEQMRLAFIEKCPEAGNERFLLFLSRIHEKKGVDLLINAYLKVFYPEKSEPVLATGRDNFDSDQSIPKLVIAGPGIESAYGQKIKQLVDENEFLRDQVYFPGMLSGDSKWGAFYTCEAFVLPSHQENFGIAVAEALACSKPVLISDQVNIWREIDASGAGVISNDSLEGTQKLLEVWESITPQERSKMGEKAWKSFDEYFSIPLTAQKLMRAIYS
jgi:glycosyltransferase involved in cell wall biosynthesis